MNLYTITTKTEKGSGIALITSALNPDGFKPVLDYTKQLFEIAEHYNCSNTENIENYLDEIYDIDCGDNGSLLEQFTVDIDEEIAEEILDMDTFSASSIAKVIEMICTVATNIVEVSANFEIEL